MAEREDPQRRGPANQYPEQRDRPRNPDHPYDDRPHEWREVRDTDYSGVPGMAGWDLQRPRRGDRPRDDERRREASRERPEPEYGPGGEPNPRESVPEGWQDRGMRPGPQYGQPGGWNAPNPGQGYGEDVYAPGWSERQPFHQQANFAGRGPRGYVRSDERIADDLADRLTRDPRIDASEIEIEVKNCEVTLRGTVESRPMKHLAEDLADAIPGVRDVHNSLRVARVGSERGGQQERKTARPEVRVGEGGEQREGHIGPPPGQPAQSRNAADAGRPPG